MLSNLLILSWRIFSQTLANMVQLLHVKYIVGTH